jgi:simple sugar transport system permease protein
MDLLASALRIATPLLLAAAGGVLSERAGVFAVGLEGMMLAGAFAAVLGTTLAGVAAGMAAASLAGALIGLAVAIVAVRFRADQMVTGLSANILAVGLTSYAVRLVPGGLPDLRPLSGWHCPVLADLPWIGDLFVQPPLTWLALFLLVAVAFFLTRTQAGLTLRATGENPDAVFASGTDPLRVRMRAVIACGAIAGLGGAVLPLQQVGTFTENMTGGRGYLALASLIVGRWHPAGAAAACLAFGVAEACQLELEAAGTAGNPYLLQMLPYLTALAILALVGRSARLPAAIGRALSFR